MGRAECEHGCLRRQCLVCELTAENRKLRGDVEQAMKAADSAIALLAGPAHDARVSLEARCQRLWGALESCVYELNNHSHSIFGDPRGGVIEALKEAARAMATHRCKVCGALWRLNPPSAVQTEGSWSLAYGEKCGKCCDKRRHGRPNRGDPLMDTTSMGTCFFVGRQHDGTRPHAESQKCHDWHPMPLQMPKVDRQGRAYESLTRAANDIGARGDELEKLLVRFDAAFWGTFCCECGILLSLPLCPSLGEECAPVHDLVIEAHLALECEHDRPRRDCGVCRIADPVSPAPVQACSTFAPDNNDGDCANCGEGLETHTDKETPA